MAFMLLCRKSVKFMDKSVIIKLNGRMANQMFEWAFGRALMNKNNCNLLFDNSEETFKLDYFNLKNQIKFIKKPLLNKFLRKTIPFRKLRNKLTKLNFNNLKNIEEKSFCHFEQELLNISDATYIKGFFQTEKYFADIREDLIQDFTLNIDLNKANKDMIEKIKNSNSISVQFRRGDYTKKRVADKYGSCSVDYYKNGIKKIAKTLDEKPTIFIFSDDINWVKNNVNFDYATVYVDINSGKQGYLDLELMKNCKHNVIANSSFSWWGAWLNTNSNKKVVAPKWWMKDIDSSSCDIIPDNWILLDNK